MSDAKHDRVQKPSVNNGQGVMRRLLRSESGNVIAMTAAATIPMLGVIGGAIDISRVYLTKSRVQAACDSAVLAGRKAMTTLTYTTAAKARADSMFNVNFQDDDYGTEGTDFDSSADSSGKVTGTATTTVPMVIMGMFGAGDADLSVTCSADIQIPNIDIVMVLDVTGSMDECPDGSCNSYGEQKKIDALKVAAKDFYTTLQTAMAGNTVSQIRYGFVPYSQAVNVKDLFKVSPDATKGEMPISNLTDSMVVESRVANFNTAVTSGWKVDTSATPTTFNQWFNKNTNDSKEPFVAVTGAGTNISDYDCDQYGANLSFQIDDGSNVKVNLYPRVSSSFTSEGVGTSVFYIREGQTSLDTTEPTSGNSYTKVTFARVQGSTNSTYAACRRSVTRTKYIRETGYKLTSWIYKQVPYNVSQFKNGTSLNYVSAVDSNYTVQTAGEYDPVALRALTDQSGLTSSSTTWDGCIEERNTVAVSNFVPIPTNAIDLNYIDAGTSASYRWRPVLRDLTYNRGGPSNVTRTVSQSQYGNPGYTCPSARVRNLNVMTQTQFNTYIDSLSPGGNTYLDMGMVWGLRLISPQGMWASRNLTGPNGGQIARHIIFLTDGVPAEASSSYTSYGVEDISQRIKGTTGVSLATLHSRRFQALCDAQRGAVNIWAIGFGTSVTGNLTNCADPGRALEANNPTELRNAFRSIAQQVADLRLVQ